MPAQDALRKDAEEFQQFLTKLMPWGALVSLVGPDYRLLVPEPIIYLTPVVTVLEARSGAEGSIVYDVIFGYTNAPQGTALSATITDPLISDMPHQYLAERLAYDGTEQDPQTFIRLNSNLSPEDLKRIIRPS